MRNSILTGLLLILPALAEQATAQTVLERQATASGGARTASATTHVTGVLGQPAIGIASTRTTWHCAGFLLPLADDASAVPELPAEYRLRPNYPNPFNPSTTIGFDLPRSGRVRLEVFGLDGRLVAVLLDEKVEAGYRQVAWRGLDNHGRPVASGAYFYRITAGGFERTERMMLVK